MDKVKIMPFGDSITNGFTVAGAYRNRLCDLLEQNGYKEKVEFVGSDKTGTGYDNRNEGHPGWAIAKISPDDDCGKVGREGITEYADEWLENAKPDIVLLQIGTNDILSLYDLDNAGNRLEILVDKILKVLPKYGSLYMTFIPYISVESPYDKTGKNQDEMYSMIDDYNKKVGEIAKKKSENGYNVEIADINDLLSFDDLQDGVHPHKDGYTKMGDYWYNRIIHNIDNLLNN